MIGHFVGDQDNYKQDLSDLKRIKYGYKLRLNNISSSCMVENQSILIESMVIMDS